MCKRSTRSKRTADLLATATHIVGLSASDLSLNLTNFLGKFEAVYEATADTLAPLAWRAFLSLNLSHRSGTLSAGVRFHRPFRETNRGF